MIHHNNPWRRNAAGPEAFRWLKTRFEAARLVVVCFQNKPLPRVWRGGRES